MEVKNKLRKMKILPEMETETQGLECYRLVIDKEISISYKKTNQSVSFFGLKCTILSKIIEDFDFLMFLFFRGENIFLKCLKKQDHNFDSQILLENGNMLANILKNGKIVLLKIQDKFWKTTTKTLQRYNLFSLEEIKLELNRHEEISSISKNENDNLFSSSTNIEKCGIFSFIEEETNKKNDTKLFCLLSIQKKGADLIIWGLDENLYLTQYNTSGKKSFKRGPGVKLISNRNYNSFFDNRNLLIECKCFGEKPKIKYTIQNLSDYWAISNNRLLIFGKNGIKIFQIPENTYKRIIVLNTFSFLNVEKKIQNRNDKKYYRKSHDFFIDYYTENYLHFAKIVNEKKFLMSDFSVKIRNGIRYLRTEKYGKKIGNILLCLEESICIFTSLEFFFVGEISNFHKSNQLLTCIGPYFILMKENFEFYIYSFETYRPFSSFSIGNSKRKLLCFSNSSAHEFLLVYIFQPMELEIWEVRLSRKNFFQPNLVKNLTFSSGVIRLGVVSKNNDFIALCLNYYDIIIWSKKNSRVVKKNSKGNYKIIFIDFSKDHQFLIAGAMNGNLYVISTEPKTHNFFSIKLDKILRNGIIPLKENRIGLFSKNGKVIILDMKRIKKLKIFFLLRVPLASFGFSFDEMYLYLFSQKGRIIIYKEMSKTIFQERVSRLNLIANNHKKMKKKVFNILFKEIITRKDPFIFYSFIQNIIGTFKPKFLLFIETYIESAKFAEIKTIWDFCTTLKLKNFSHLFLNIFIRGLFLFQSF